MRIVKNMRNTKSTKKSRSPTDVNLRNQISKSILGAINRSKLISKLASLVLIAVILTLGAVIVRLPASSYMLLALATVSIADVDSEMNTCVEIGERLVEDVTSSHESNDSIDG